MAIQFIFSPVLLWNLIVSVIIASLETDTSLNCQIKLVSLARCLTINELRLQLHLTAWTQVIFPFSLFFLYCFCLVIVDHFSCPVPAKLSALFPFLHILWVICAFLSKTPLNRKVRCGALTTVTLQYLPFRRLIKAANMNATPT